MVKVMSSVASVLLGSGDRPKVHFAGTHRTRSPKDTLDAIRPHFDQLGITRLGDITGLDTIGIPVAQAVRPMARSLSVSQGKGATADLARVSAAMEAAEKWHAEHMELQVVIDRPSALRKQARLVASTLRHSGSGVPKPLDDAPMRVVAGRDICSGDRVFVPVDQVTMDFTVVPDQSMVVQSSNGLASGNTLAEAVASAFFEVIERDALADFDGCEDEQKAARRVPLSWCAKIGADREVSAVSSAGLQLTVWDVTNDIGVPTFSAAILETGEGRVGPGASGFGGSGTHLDPKVAVLRAIHEAAQSRATAIAGVREDLEVGTYKKPKTVPMPRFEMLFAGEPAHVPDSTDQSGGSALSDVETMLRRLVDAGCKSLAVVDLTRDDIGIPVVRVVAPELGLILPGHGYGRGTRHFRRNLNE